MSNDKLSLSQSTGDQHHKSESDETSEKREKQMNIAHTIEQLNTKILELGKIVAALNSAKVQIVGSQDHMGITKQTFEITVPDPESTKPYMAEESSGIIDGEYEGAPTDDTKTFCIDTPNGPGVAKTRAKREAKVVLAPENAKEQPKRTRATVNWNTVENAVLVAVPKDGSHVTANDILTVAGFDIAHVRIAIAKLVKEGKISQHGVKRGTTYSCVSS